MMSRSGVLVLPENDAAPPLVDIALSLSRQPRFGGHTVDPWSVAEHSMVVALIARYRSAHIYGRVVAGTIQELYGLLHDAHESVTGDIPSTWKVPAMRELQERLDARIYYTLGLTPPGALLRALIHDCDRAALLAEAKIVATAGVYEAIRDKGIGTEDQPQPEAEHDALLAVEDIRLRAFTQEQAAAYYLGWTQRLINKWSYQPA